MHRPYRAGVVDTSSRRTPPHPTGRWQHFFQCTQKVLPDCRIGTILAKMDVIGWVIIHPNHIAEHIAQATFLRP